MFSSDFSDFYPDQMELLTGNLMAMDRPRHQLMRGLISRAFTPRVIAQLAGRIGELTTELLDSSAEEYKLELVADLAYPLPVIVIAELLGIPTEDRPMFKVWVDSMLSNDNVDPTDETAVEEGADTLRKVVDYLREHAVQRRLSPRRDLLSDLVAAEIDGHRLDDREIASFAAILFIAGHMTTTALLGNSIRCLDANPEAQEQLRKYPEKLPTAIEEVLRYESPFAKTSRVTPVEVELAGQLIPPKQMIEVWFGSANRDERQFVDADEFQIDRSPNHHLGLGKGIHFCLGAPLARLETKIALEIMLQRYSSIRVDYSHPIEPHPEPGFNGVTALHLDVEPAA
ncbi:cytochrome P450 [Saccharopolyspora shandongensis]|uniref:cytochrome P450 n=1 Tax=Saccharopolyspora shandongensis TaxID=418495 RepID=UPI0033C8BC9E